MFWRSFQIMISGMFCFRHQFQILNSIIRSIMILMVNEFIRRKISSYVFFHNEPMFQNISTFGSKRMIASQYLSISQSALYSSAFPLTVFITRWKTSEFHTSSCIVMVFVSPWSASFVCLRSEFPATTCTGYHNILYNEVSSI